jgi:uncharacterized membrane protein
MQSLRKQINDVQNQLKASKISEFRRLWKEEKERDKIAAYENQISDAALKPFAYGICADKLFWLFVIGSIYGFALETVFCFLVTGCFEIRTGLVLGMFIPVYGFGAVALTLGLRRLYRLRDLWIFLCSAVIGGSIEYFSSLGQEIAFGTVSWDYSNTQYNFGGRTNLTYSFMWGILGILWIKDWYPKISKAIERIPKKYGKPITYIVLIIVVFDIVLSAAAVTRKVQRFYNEPPKDSFEVFLDQYFDDDYLNFVYPHMKIPDCNNKK